ncbi:uncharacterized protein LOC111706268 [Eurytemora carolleeae]|uniref:uncharacterized protein LOC111706268 n=1 Tax=Eurytemora carolleeae TaxID=1294199 RepID=UPI000C77BF17|nr:uncharacterized protein LOC111706268 [Eurytemora carolleeae]|eukprot:XP_023334868.1 uncharacterized protein LOC111706268 [Eurytemora affinis]
MKKGKLIACLLNISEGRREKILNVILNETIKTIVTGGVTATIISTFSDKEYNRTVLTICGDEKGVSDAVTSTSCQVMKYIDIRVHQGGHPRLGAVDLIPIHPLTPDISLEECGRIARKIANSIEQQNVSSSFYFYGGSDPTNRTLINKRKEFGWFNSVIKKTPDMGTYNPQVGLSGVGSSYYMTNFNITLETQDAKIGDEVLKRVRERELGFRGVSAMAFPHQGGLEIACNVDMFPASLNQDDEVYQEIMPGVWRTRFRCIEEATAKVCSKYNTKIRGDSLIVGFTPEEALERTITALQTRNPCTVNPSSPVHM